MLSMSVVWVLEALLSAVRAPKEVVVGVAKELAGVGAPKEAAIGVPKELTRV